MPGGCGRLAACGKCAPVRKQVPSSTGRYLLVLHFNCYLCRRLTIVISDGWIRITGQECPYRLRLITENGNNKEGGSMYVLTVYRGASVDQMVNYLDLPDKSRPGVSRGHSLMSPWHS